MTSTSMFYFTKVMSELFLEQEPELERVRSMDNIWAVCYAKTDIDTNDTYVKGTCLVYGRTIVGWIVLGALV